MPKGWTKEVNMERARSNRKKAFIRNTSVSVCIYKFEVFRASRAEMNERRTHAVETGTIRPKSLNHSAPDKVEMIRVVDAITLSL